MAESIIQSVEAISVRLPRDLAGATGTAGTPNQLAGSGAYRWSRDYPALYSIYIETALIKVTLSNGLTGWGEAQAPLAPEVACTIVDKLLRPVLEGAVFRSDRECIEQFWSSMYSTMRVRGQTGGFMLDAISGVDLALWDLAGKMEHVPVSAMLVGGPAKPRMPAYVSGLPGGSTAARIEAARPFLDQGFRTFKLYYESDWNAVLEQIEGLQCEAGVGVAVDALWHLDPDRAVEQARELDRRGALWLECPLIPEDIDAHIHLARSIQTPIALGESYRTRYELAPFLRERVLRFVQPDLGRSGITESMRIAAVANSHGVAVVPHVSIALGPQLAAALHFAAAAPDCELCEYNPRVLEVANRFLLEPLQMQDAAWVIPDGPGLGVDIDEQELRAAMSSVI